MAKEIERKYLVTDDSYLRLAVSSSQIVQGYISRAPEGTVRVRVRDNRGFITIKSLNDGIRRNEWEYEIPRSEAMEMLSTVCRGSVIDKTRYLVPFEGYTWEVDVFHNVPDPAAADSEHPRPMPSLLRIAEVELESEAARPPLPPFVGKEVSDNPAYFNSALKTIL